MNDSSPLTLILGIACFLIYFAPFSVSYWRNHPNKLPIFLVNLFLGWTLIGWFFALIWSTLHIKREITHVYTS